MSKSKSKKVTKKTTTTREWPDDLYCIDRDDCLWAYVFQSYEAPTEWYPPKQAYSSLGEAYEALMNCRLGEGTEDWIEDEEESDIAWVCDKDRTFATGHDECLDGQWMIFPMTVVK